MFHQPKPLLTALLLAVAAPSLHAAGLLAGLQPRSMGMGGVAVALPDPALSPLANPAGLALTTQKEPFALVIPQIGVRINDPESILDTVDRLQNGELDQLDNAINQANTSLDPAVLADQYRAVSHSGTTVNRELLKMNGAPLYLEGAAALSFAVPKAEWAYAFYAGMGAQGGALFHYAPTDQQTISSLLGSVNTAANCLSAVATAASLGDQCNINNSLVTLNFDAASGALTEANINYQTQTIGSEVVASAFLLSEIGFSLANQYPIAGRKAAFGITPKYLKMSTYHYAANVNSADVTQDTLDRYRSDSSGFTADVGALYSIDSHLMVGATLRNLIPQEFDFKNNGVKVGSLELDPLLTLGVAYTMERYTLAADLDLTEESGFSGSKGSRILGLGGEFNAWEYLQLRGGYRTDLSNSGRDSFSLGLGVRAGFEFDLAAVLSSNEIGGAVRLGAAW